MTLRLHQHPFASYCQKAIMAFYENGALFEPVVEEAGPVRSVFPGPELAQIE